MLKGQGLTDRQTEGYVDSTGSELRPASQRDSDSFARTAGRPFSITKQINGA